MLVGRGNGCVTLRLSSPEEVDFAVRRGQGVGIAASIGKIGAVAGVFVIPVLLKSGGAATVLAVSAIVMAVGALVTKGFSKASDLNSGT
jgi:nitrate/nitrite transporter NarK